MLIVIDAVRLQAPSVGSFIGRSILFTLFTAETKPEHLIAPLVCYHPRSNHPRRIVTNVLIVTARKLGNPVPFVVGVIASDRLLHCEIFGILDTYRGVTAAN
jgi:hypothetical protein